MIFGSFGKKGNMAKVVVFTIKESVKEISLQLYNCNNGLLSKRLSALRLFKLHEAEGLSVARASEVLGLDGGSIGKWRRMYIEGGLDLLLQHEKKGYKLGDIPAHHSSLKAKLEDPQNGIQGHRELLEWFNTEHGTSVNYHALNKYVKRNFGASVKVARKSHVKKDGEKVAAFKKTSNKTAGSS